MTPLHYDNRKMKNIVDQILRFSKTSAAHTRIYLIRRFLVEICNFLVYVRFNVSGTKDDRLTNRMRKMVNMIQRSITCLRASAPSDGVRSEEILYLSSTIDRWTTLVSIEETQNSFVRVFKLIRDSLD